MANRRTVTARACCPAFPPRPATTGMTTASNVAEAISSLNHQTTAAARLADSIAANPPWAVQGTLRAIWAAQDLGRLAARDVAAAIYAAAMDPAALAEGSETFASGARTKPRLR